MPSLVTSEHSFLSLLTPCFQPTPSLEWEQNRTEHQGTADYAKQQHCVCLVVMGDPRELGWSPGERTLLLSGKWLW